MRKITQSLFTLLLAFLAIGSVSAQTVITSLDQLSDSKVYTLAAGRAALDASQPKFTNTTADATSEAQQFAIHKYGESGYILYNVGINKFANKSSDKVAFDAYTTLTTFNLTAATDENRWIFNCGSDRINIGGANDLFINGWNTDDEGNQFLITEVGDLSETAQNAITEAINKEEAYHNINFTNAITSLDELSANKAYYISTPRGAWSYSPTDNAEVLTSTSNTAERYIDMTLMKFAILKSSLGNYYIYNVNSQKFVGINGQGTSVTDAPTLAGSILNASDARKAAGYPWVIAINGKQINVTPSYKEIGGIISFWNDVNDEGNAVAFAEAGDINTDAAMSAIEAFEGENEMLSTGVSPRNGYSFSVFPEVEIDFNNTPTYNDNGDITIKKDDAELGEGYHISVTTDSDAAYISLIKGEAPVTEEGTYTITIPAGTFKNDKGLTNTEAIELTYTIKADAPSGPLSVVSVTPDELGNEDATFEAFPEVSVTFNREVTVDESKTISVYSMLGGGRGIKVSAKVSDEDAKTVIITTTGVTESGTYTMIIPEDIFVDQYGQGNDKNEVSVYIETPANTFLPNSITPADGSTVNAISTISLSFTEPGLVREDRVANIKVVNAATNEEVEGKVISAEFPFTINGKDNYSDIVITFDNIVEAGKYIITIPEGLVYDNFADENEDDYGVSFGATYNPEITITLTVDPTLTSINSAKANTNAKNNIYTISGMKVNKASQGVFIINGKKEIVK